MNNVDKARLSGEEDRETEKEEKREGEEGERSRERFQRKMTKKAKREDKEIDALRYILEQKTLRHHVAKRRGDIIVYQQIFHTYMRIYP